MFFTNDAGIPELPGNTAILVDPGRSNANLIFFGDRQLFDGARGTDLSAERAVVFAVSYFRYENGRPEPFRTGLCPGGLQGVGGADLHTFTTSDTFL